MSKINTLLKENYDLKNELEGMLLRIKENEAKHKGFKVVQYALLLSDHLNEISDKSLHYMEEIFEIDKAAIFIKKGVYSIAYEPVQIGSRILIIDEDAFNFTFLNSTLKCGSDKSIIHKDFKLLPSDHDFSYVLAPIEEGNEVVGALGFYSIDNSRFNHEQNTDFIKEFAFIVGIVLKKLNNTYLYQEQLYTDSVTLLPNRQILNLRINEHIEYLTHRELPFSLALVDICDFKSINSKYGYEKGDILMRNIGQLMQSIACKNAVAGRFLDDEFYILFDTIDEQIIDNFIEQIKCGLNSGFDDFKDENIKLAIGITKISSQNDFKDYMDIIQKTSDKMYTAKLEKNKDNSCVFIIN